MSHIKAFWLDPLKIKGNCPLKAFKIKCLKYILGRTPLCSLRLGRREREITERDYKGTSLTLIIP